MKTMLSVSPKPKKKYKQVYVYGFIKEIVF